MMLQRMAVFDTLESKEEALVGYTKSAGGRLGRWGNLGLDEKENDRRVRL